MPMGPLRRCHHTKMKRLIPIFAFCVFCVPMWAQATYTAASANYSDVNAVINGPTHTAINGDIIQIPCSGTQSVTWTSQLVVTASIKLTALGGTPNTGTGTVGAGTNCLTIVDNDTAGILLVFQPTYASSNNLTTIENVNIDPNSTSTALYSPISVAGTCTTVNNCPQLRIDNVVFGKGIQWNEGNNSSNADTMIRADNVFGVLDHNTVPSGTTTLVFANISHSAYGGVGSYGDNSWAQADSFGGGNNVYLENNHIWTTASVTDQEFNAIGGAIGGGRVVARYNTVEAVGGFFELLTGHGMDTDGRPRSIRQMEAYSNTVNCTSGGCQGLVGFRGGTGIVYNNTLNSNFAVTGGYYNNIAPITVYRTVYNGPTWGPCGGLNSLDPWDTNDGTTTPSGTTTSGSSGLMMNDSTANFSNLLPAGAPFSVYDVTKNFVAEIASFTSTSITIQGNIPEQANSFGVGDTYQIIRSTVCADQAGRGQGNYVSGTTPSPVLALSEALDPIYEWNDTAGNLNHGNIGTVGNGVDTARVTANRDWYTDASNGTPHIQTSSTSPFNGTGGSGIGVGFGTLANRPSTCTVQVGYWATDTSTLYLCKTSNTWTASYSPYTYPHPLTSGPSMAAPFPILAQAGK